MTFWTESDYSLSPMAKPVPVLHSAH